MNPLVKQRQQINTQNLQKWLASLLAAGAGVGMLGRGATGLYNTSRRAAGSPASPTSATLLPIPIQREEEEEKTADDQGWLEFLFANRGAKDISGIPIFGPASMAAPIGGAALGWKLTDMVLDARRRQQMKGELEKTKKDYEQALLPPGNKAASSLGQTLDTLFDKCEEKQALLGNQAGGQFTGGLLAGWLPLAVVSAMITHNMTSSRRRKKLLDKAVSKKHREQLSRSPVYAYPEPVKLP